MSHKATSWLASLPPNRIGASEFRVLFHLCDSCSFALDRSALRITVIGTRRAVDIKGCPSG